jgi:hypothetical protein
MDFLQTMVDDASKPGLKGWFQTHPSPTDRMERVGKEIEGLGSVPQKEAARTTRFQNAVKAL